MHKENDFDNGIRKLLQHDERYQRGAYEFIRHAVTYTATRLKEENPETGRHISGQQLLDGFRQLALQQFGPLTIDVLNEWGLHASIDVGNVVFNLVNNGLLGASDEDSLSDFADGLDFREAFVKPFSESGGMPEALPKIA